MHQRTALGSFSVTFGAPLEVTDNDGATSVSNTIVLDIANLDPNISTSLNANDQTGSLVVTGSFADPGDDFHLAMADFGDGTRRRKRSICPVG